MAKWGEGDPRWLVRGCLGGLPLISAEGLNPASLIPMHCCAPIPHPYTPMPVSLTCSYPLSQVENREDGANVNNWYVHACMHAGGGGPECT